MAEDFRSTGAGRVVMDERTKNMVDECRRQEESCLYTSTLLFEWLKSLRLWRAVFVVVPIVLGGIATSSLLKQRAESAPIVGICALLAGLGTAVYKALGFDVSVDAVTKHAHQFKVLQDRFRQAWRVTALGPFDDFKTEFAALMDRMDAARAASLTAPERFFEMARRKIEKGHYEFVVDANAPASVPGAKNSAT